MAEGRRYGLLSSSVLYMFGSMVQRLISIISLPIFTHYLTPSDYGIVGLLASLPVLLLPTFTLGVGASIGVCYFASDDRLHRLSVINSAQTIAYFSAILLMGVSLFFLNFITVFFVGDLAYRAHSLVAIATIAFSILCQPLQLKQQFETRPIAFVIISMFGALITILVSVIGIVTFRLGALGMLLGPLGGQIITWILLVLSNRGQRPFLRGASRKLMIELLRHGIPMLPGFFLLFVMQNGVRWPLNWIHGVGAVGLYSLGTSFGSALTIFTSGVVAAWMPWALAQASRWTDARHDIACRFLQYFIVGGFFVVVLFAAAQPILKMLASPSFFPAWTVVGLSAASNLLISLFSLILPPVYMARRVSLVLIAQTAAALATLASAALLIDIGIVGAALAVVIGSLVLVLVQYLVNIRLTMIEPVPYPLTRIALVATMVILACIISSMISVELGTGFFVGQACVLTVLGMILYRLLPNLGNLLTLAGLKGRFMPLS